MLTRQRLVLLVLVLLTAGLTGPLHSEPVRSITIDGKFEDWKNVPAYKDPPNNEHDTDHKKIDDKPERVDHADVDLLEYKIAHDADNLFAYFKARGVIGRTQTAGPGKKAGRYYAIVTIDVDNEEKTGYWLHEGGFYPTSRGYDVNAEIEWYGGRLNTGHSINHACRDQAELDQAFLDQSSGQFKKGHPGPYKAGFVRLGPGTYKHYTEWVYHANDTLTFVRDQGPQVLGIIKGALSTDGHELEMIIPLKAFLVDPKGQPLIKLGQKINISMSLEASGELAKGKRWASNTGEPIRGYVLEHPRKAQRR
ncbi:MAG: hypothetical protein L0Z62_00135 [Gemmataceae bacterium]|nr:hypothetical protein [Gemmataceae bacterium]